MDYILKKGSIKMYISMALLAGIIFPLWVISKGIELKNPPFNVLIVGTIYAVCGALLVIGLAAIGGYDMSTQIDSMVKNVTSSNDALKALGMDQLSSKEQSLQLTTYYKNVFILLPTVFFVWGAIISYLEYRIVYKRKIKKGKDAIPMPPLNEFSMEKRACTGWFLLYLVSIGLMYSGLSYGQMIHTNVYALIQYAFALQGISFTLQLFKLKRIPKAIAVIVCILMLSNGTGLFVLFLLGFADLAIGLKGRIRGR